MTLSHEVVDSHYAAESPPHSRRPRAPSLADLHEEADAQGAPDSGFRIEISLEKRPPSPPGGQLRRELRAERRGGGESTLNALPPCIPKPPGSLTTNVDVLPLVCLCHPKSFTDPVIIFLEFVPFAAIESHLGK